MNGVVYHPIITVIIILLIVIVTIVIVIASYSPVPILSSVIMTNDRMSQI